MDMALADSKNLTRVDLDNLAKKIRRWSKELGFQQIGFVDTDLAKAETRLNHWLANDRHGEMAYMSEHGNKRSQPELLIPTTVCIISARMNYWPEQDVDPASLLDKSDIAYISRYSLGRDYHKVIRNRLQKLADQIESEIGAFNYRVFADSAPVLEKPIAEKAGLGWIGKHTNVINKDEGSWFFLGEIYVDLALPIDKASENHCGTCHSCLDACPTDAIVAPYELDAHRCISYLTIELKGSIPVELRPLMGNRIYGCDDCQLVCPWNRFARISPEKDFQIRHGLDQVSLLTLFNWTEDEFLKYTEGSAIRRIGFVSWLRNIAVALGNGKRTNEVIEALQNKQNHSSKLVSEHAHWALQQLD